MKKISFMAMIAFVFLVMMNSGCGSARRGEPLVGALNVSFPPVAEGQKVFVIHCHQCHPGGEGGQGPALNNKPLPAFLMKLQIRNGLGAMPGFSKEKISDAELDNLIAYIMAVRHRHN